MFIIASSVFAQTGNITLGIGGNLFDRYSPKKGKASSTIAPNANGTYMFTDKIGIDGIVGYNKPSSGSSSVTIGAGARYYFWAQDKMHANAGLDAEVVSGGGGTNLKAFGEAEYWPMEGGALFADVYYKMDDLGDAGSRLGIGLGVKVRIK